MDVDQKEIATFIYCTLLRVYFRYVNSTQLFSDIYIYNSSLKLPHPKPFRLLTDCRVKKKIYRIG